MAPGEAEVRCGSVCEILAVSISRPIYPQERTSRAHLRTSEKCQKATFKDPVCKRHKRTLSTTCSGE